MFGGHSFWYYLILFFSNLLLFLLGGGGPFGILLTIDSVPTPVWSTLTELLGYFSYWIDFGTMFSCLAIVFGWRYFWLLMRFWRIVLEMVPMLG